MNNCSCITCTYFEYIYYVSHVHILCVRIWLYTYIHGVCVHVQVNMYTYIYIYVYVHVNMYTYIYIHVYVRPTWWRRPIGCFKLQVVFCKRATIYRALLREITYTDKASYGSSPPCSGCRHTCSIFFADILTKRRRIHVHTRPPL